MLAVESKSRQIPSPNKDVGSGLLTKHTMSTYEEEPNPFRDDEEVSYGVSSNSSLTDQHNGDETSTPPAALDSSQSTLGAGGRDSPQGYAISSPSLPSTPQPPRPAGYKGEIDRYLHSGDDIEILVSYDAYFEARASLKAVYHVNRSPTQSKLRKTRLRLI